MAGLERLHMQPTRRAVLGATLACAATVTAPRRARTTGPLVVRYPQEEGRVIEDGYPFALLRLALERSGVPVDLRPAKTSMPEARQRFALERGEDLDVAWFGTSSEFERRLRPIYIPIDRGLLGWRLAIIRAVDQPVFSAVQTLDDLRALVAMQGTGWSDVEILSANGLEVQTADYSLLFRMLANGRGDFFPRGVTEAFAEVERFADDAPGIAVERSLVVRYPFGKLFFVRSTNDDLAAALEAGLEAVQADGSFEALFRTHPDNAVALAAADLASRRILDIENPLLSDRMRSIPQQFFHQV